MPADLVPAAATVVSAAALACAATALAATRSVRTALQVLLDLLLAAGLLRLAGATSWESIGSAALLVVVRKIAVAGLGQPPRAGLSRRATRAGP